MNATVPTRHWHTLPEGKVQCDVCPRHCQLAEGQRGLCFVRAREHDAVVLTTWGRSSGYCVDPIEKKPLDHFLPGTPVLSFGTAGCNLGCKFCQNWSISKSREIEQLSENASPQAVAQAALKLGCRSVAYTYNDPVIWAEYAIDCAQACRDVGVKSVAVTAGYITPEARPAFYEYMDALPEAKTIRATHTHHRLSDELFARVRAQFEKHVTPAGARFMRPMRVNLLRRAH